MTPQVGSQSRVRLWPFVVKGRDDRYAVIDRGSRRAIATSKAGVEAIRLLSRGRTVEQTQQTLGRRYGHAAGDVDLTPLLETLFASGFVRTLDGTEVGARREPGGRGLAVWLTLMVWGPLVERSIRHLPLPLAQAVAYRWFAPFSGADTGSAPTVRRHFADRLLLASLPPRRLRQWLRAVPVSGLEHLASAQAGGKGVILCSLHLGSYGLIPFLLAARGIPVTVYSGFGDDARANVGDWLSERARHGDAYPIGMVGGGMGPRTLARCLEQGGTVLLYVDQSPGPDQRSAAARGWIAAPFLGGRIWCPPGVGWLREHTGAAVLPLALRWEGAQGHRLHVGPEVVRDGGSDAVTLSLFAALERYVQPDPTQWQKATTP